RSPKSPPNLVPDPSYLVSVQEPFSLRRHFIYLAAQRGHHWYDFYVLLCSRHHTRTFIPEQFTVKAQRPLLGVKKRWGRGGGGGGGGGAKNLFVGKSYELSRTVFTSEIGQYIFFV